MANQQHLDLFIQNMKTHSMETWNQLRIDHADAQQDLSRAVQWQFFLLRADLYRADFSGLDLSEKASMRGSV